MGPKDTDAFCKTPRRRRHTPLIPAYLLSRIDPTPAARPLAISLLENSAPLTRARRWRDQPAQPARQLRSVRATKHAAPAVSEEVEPSLTKAQVLD